jgi:CRP/FNR family cyclic AMP-dependent transcriptional regulator
LERTVLFNQGEILFDSQRPAGCVYLLERGIVQLSDDSGLILDYLGAGDFFGEKIVLSGPQTAQVAIAISPARVRPFRKQELLDLVQQDRRFALRLLKALASRLERHERTIREFAKEPVARRLAFLLFRLLPDRPGEEWVRLPWNPTNPELARSIGTTRWRVSRLMSRFSRLGWLRRQDGLWINREAFATYLDANPSRPN